MPRIRNRSKRITRTKPRYKRITRKKPRSKRITRKKHGSKRIRGGMQKGMREGKQKGLRRGMRPTEAEIAQVHNEMDRCRLRDAEEENHSYAVKLLDDGTGTPPTADLIPGQVKELAVWGVTKKHDLENTEGEKHAAIFESILKQEAKKMYAKITNNRRLASTAAIQTSDDFSRRQKPLLKDCITTITQRMSSDIVRSADGGDAGGGVSPGTGLTPETEQWVQSWVDSTAAAAASATQTPEPE